MIRTTERMSDPIADAIAGVHCIHNGNHVLGGGCFASKPGVHPECVAAALPIDLGDGTRIMRVEHDSDLITDEIVGSEIVHSEVPLYREARP